MVSSSANSSAIFPALRELTATSIYVIWSRLLIVGPVNYRTRTYLDGFDAGDLFVCGNRVTGLLHPDLEDAFSNGLGHSGHFNRSR